MTEQCCVCRRIRDGIGGYRHPFPGELPFHVRYIYCPSCASEALRLLRKGELPPRHVPAAPRPSY